MRRAAPVLAFVGAGLALLAIRVWWFADPIFWDENCYVGQARMMAAHRFDFAAYHSMPFVRPPLFTSLLAVALQFSPSLVVLRAVTFALALPLLPLTFVLTLELGGSRRAAWLAAGACAIAPIYVTQVGLVLSDVATANLFTLAWILLLDRRTFAFMICAALSVWTKESAYTLCAPAALLLYLRKRSIWAIAPASVPGFALLAWLGCHKLLTGVAIPNINANTLGFHFLWESLNHALVESGRYALTALAAWSVLRPLPAWKRDELRCTAVAVLALAVMFPGPLPRYMLPSLPLLCALAGLSLERVPPRQRFAAPGLVAIALLAGWFGRSWHTDAGGHLDYNLTYRSLALAQREAAHAIAVARPTRVLATFPMYFSLTVGPEDRVLPAPVPADLPRPDQTLAELCRYDFIVDQDQGEPVDRPLRTLRAANALQPYLTFGRPSAEVRVLRIACPPAS